MMLKKPPQSQIAAGLPPVYAEMTRKGLSLDAVQLKDKSVDQQKIEKAAIKKL